MTLKERINNDMKAAMRAGETGKRDAIRLLTGIRADIQKYCAMLHVNMRKRTLSPVNFAFSVFLT